MNIVIILLIIVLFVIIVWPEKPVIGPKVDTRPQEIIDVLEQKEAKVYHVYLPEGFSYEDGTITNVYHIDEETFEKLKDKFQ